MKSSTGASGAPLWPDTTHTIPRLPITELALFHSWIVQLLSRNRISAASFVHERATVLNNTSVLCCFFFFLCEKLPGTKPAVKNRWPSSRGLSFARVEQAHAVLQLAGEGEVGCMCGFDALRHTRLDSLGSHTIVNCLILFCPKGQERLNVLLPSHGPEI